MMSSQHNNADSRVRRVKRRGFTLVELAIVVTIVGVMAAMSIPSFKRAIVQSRADVAAANLRAIWAAERLYWLEYHSYTVNLSSQPSPPPGLVDLGLLDPAIFDNVAGNYIYTVAPDASGIAVGFTATATSPDGTISIRINEAGVVTATGISVGFQ